MTVNTADIVDGPYAGNGVTVNFSYNFAVVDKTQMEVFETDDAGVETLLTVDTNYTVNNVGDDSGTVTRAAGALPLNYTWYIRANYPETQLTDFSSQGGFFPDVHESAFDKLTYLSLQSTDRLNRTIRFSDSYTGTLGIPLPDPVTGSFLKWTAAGGFENSSSSADLSAPGAIGNVTPSTGAFTTLTATTVDGRDVAVDGTKLDTISTGAEVNPDLISQAESEAGVATTERIFSALRVAQAIAALATGKSFNSTIVTATQTMTAGDQKLCDSIGGSFEMRIPATIAIGDTFEVKQLDINTVTVDGTTNSKTLFSVDGLTQIDGDQLELSTVQGTFVRFTAISTTELAITAYG